MRRVVITGIGVISPVGSDLDTFWQNITAGKHGITPIDNLDTSDLDVKLAATVRDFDPVGRGWLEKKVLRRIDRY